MMPDQHQRGELGLLARDRFQNADARRVLGAKLLGGMNNNFVPFGRDLDHRLALGTGPFLAGELVADFEPCRQPGQVISIGMETLGASGFECTLCLIRRGKDAINDSAELGTLDAGVTNRVANRGPTQAASSTATSSARL